MSAGGVLAQALAIGLELAAHAGRVRIRGDSPDGPRERLRKCQEEVLALLAADADDDRLEDLLERAAIQYEAEPP